MFNNSAQPSEVTSINITRTRNGFIMTRGDEACRGVVSQPYVFRDLEDLYNFLIENDFECKDE